MVLTAAEMAHLFVFVSFSSALCKSKIDSRLEALQARMIYFQLRSMPGDNNFDFDFCRASVPEKP